MRGAGSPFATLYAPAIASRLGGYGFAGEREEAVQWFAENPHPDLLFRMFSYRMEIRSVF